MAEKIVADLNINNIKRCYLNAKIEFECECGKELEHNFRDQYLSYPQVGTEDSAYFLCEQCDIEWELPMTVESALITIEYDLKDMRKV